MKQTLFFLLTILLLTLATSAFVASLIIISVDGQGAFVFILSIPLMVICFTLSFILLSYISNRILKSTSRFIHFLFASFILAFFVDAFFTKNQKFADLLIRKSSDSFEFFTGFKPYFYFRKNKILANSIATKVKESSGLIRIQDIDIPQPWEKICILGPYTTEEMAAKVIGYRSATVERSSVRHSDGVVAFVYINTSGTLEIIDIPRTPIDFASLNGHCLLRTDFPLKISELQKN